MAPTLSTNYTSEFLVKIYSFSNRDESLDFKTLVPALTAAGAIITIILRVVAAQKSGGTLGRLRADAEVLQMLPKESAAYKNLLSHMDETVATLVSERTVLTRDSTGISVSVFLLVISAIALFIAYQASGGVRVIFLAIASPFVLFTEAYS